MDLKSKTIVELAWLYTSGDVTEYMLHECFGDDVVSNIISISAGAVDLLFDPSGVTDTVVDVADAVVDDVDDVLSDLNPFW